MEVERTDTSKENDCLYFKQLDYGETFICALTYNYNTENRIVYMKCFGARYGNEYNAVRICDGYLSYAKGDLLVKRVKGKFAYSLEEGDD